MVGFLVVLELAIPLSLLLSFSLELVVFPFFAMERGKARFKKKTCWLGAIQKVVFVWKLHGPRLRAHEEKAQIP